MQIFNSSHEYFPYQMIRLIVCRFTIGKLANRRYKLVIMVDYSKWDHIEVSDDEDDTHPNIDTPSLFRWRHRARVEKMQAFEEKVKNFETRKNYAMNEYQTIKQKIEEFKTANPSNYLPEALTQEMKDIERQIEDIKEEEALLNKEKKVDVIDKSLNHITWIRYQKINSANRYLSNSIKL
ncbi:Hsp90 co-chaperone Cdc37 [Thelohanellus kitauei]|uniref:Hsp90 co-chaperone Cdc37 n=1 Tax=Thelohanellus kitauei TaxID=669202 RepID=A0A0C2ML90_THEKT|nr:Hsp90 co-chaperone Cdc37 [Thelohanellus kitauei]